MPPGMTGLLAEVAGRVKCTALPKCTSIWRIVGKSNTSVSGNSGPSSPRVEAKRLRNSVAPSESSPACMSGASADTPGSSSKVTARTIADTSNEGAARRGSAEDA